MSPACFERRAGDAWEREIRMSEFTEEVKTYLSNMNIEVVVKEKRFYNVRDFAGCRRRLEEACEIVEAKDEEIARLKDEYTCEECEKSFIDKETGINEPSICMSCWNAMVTKFLADLKAKDEEIVRLKGWVNTLVKGVIDLARCAKGNEDVIKEFKEVSEQALKG